MDKQAIVLGHILRRFPNFNFSMDTFNDRLRLQKFVYLLQAHGIYLGYDFSWYLRGPYCTALTTRGFMLRDFYDILQESGGDRSDDGFASGAARRRLAKFKELVEGHEMDVSFLEAATSLHFQLNIGMARTHDEAVSNVYDKMVAGYEYEGTDEADRVDKSYVYGVLQKMLDSGLVNGDGADPTPTVKPILLKKERVAQPEVKPDSMSPGMDARHVDKAVYFTMHDAARSGDTALGLVGVNVFRPGERRPVADEYIMDHDAVLKVRRSHGIGVRARA